MPWPPARRDPSPGNGGGVGAPAALERGERQAGGSRGGLEPRGGQGEAGVPAAEGQGRGADPGVLSRRPGKLQRPELGGRWVPPPPAAVSPVGGRWQRPEPAPSPLWCGVGGGACPGRCVWTLPCAGQLSSVLGIWGFLSPQNCVLTLFLVCGERELRRQWELSPQPWAAVGCRDHPVPGAERAAKALWVFCSPLGLRKGIAARLRAGSVALAGAFSAPFLGQPKVLPTASKAIWSRRLETQPPRKTG